MGGGLKMTYVNIKSQKLFWIKHIMLESNVEKILRINLNEIPCIPNYFPQKSILSWLEIFSLEFSIEFYWERWIFNQDVILTRFLVNVDEQCHNVRLDFSFLVVLKTE